jgi:hypothetical protein
MDFSCIAYYMKRPPSTLEDGRTSALVCYEKFERIETSQFRCVLLNMIIYRESIEMFYCFGDVSP